MTVAEEFQSLANELRDRQPAYILADMNDLLTNAAGSDIESLPAAEIPDPYPANYVAAMVEQAAHLKGNVRPPRWTSEMRPLAQRSVCCTMDCVLTLC